jgi:hypothetical protein
MEDFIIDKNTKLCQISIKSKCKTKYKNNENVSNCCMLGIYIQFEEDNDTKSIFCIPYLSSKQAFDDYFKNEILLLNPSCEWDINIFGFLGFELLRMTDRYDIPFVNEFDEIDKFKKRILSDYNEYQDLFNDLAFYYFDMHFQDVYNNDNKKIGDKLVNLTPKCILFENIINLFQNIYSVKVYNEVNFIDIKIVEEYSGNQSYYQDRAEEAETLFNDSLKLNKKILNQIPIWVETKMDFIYSLHNKKNRKILVYDDFYDFSEFRDHNKRYEIDKKYKIIQHETRQPFIIEEIIQEESNNNLIDL